MCERLIEVYVYVEYPGSPPIRTSDSNSNISALESRSIVHSIPSHATFISKLPVRLDHKEFVFRENLSKSISSFYARPISLSLANIVNIGEREFERGRGERVGNLPGRRGACHQR